MRGVYRDLREFVRALEEAGELRRIRAPVSPILEITEITDRQSKSPAPSLGSFSSRRNDPRFHHLGGHALFFEQVAGSDIPVLINAYGSYRRMEMALGATTVSPDRPDGFEAIAARIAELVKPQPPASLRDAFSAARRFLPILRVPPRRRQGLGECQQVIREGDAVDLRRLPLIRCWPLDGDLAALGYPAGVNDGVPGITSRDESIRGRYVTFAGIHTIHADDRDHPRPPSHNIGMYRVQLLGPRTMAMHWHMHHDGARHWQSWKALGRPMPVAIALGGESVLPYAATCPLPPGISELLMAGFLHGRGIELVRARTVPLWIPANAEIVIEGFVSHEAGHVNFDPRRDGPLGPGAAFEGPFGDHTGYYSLPDRYPILTVSAITHRRDPIYPTTIVGLPPQEDYFIGKATERIMLPLLRTIIPDIEDYDLPMFGAFHNCAFIKIRKSYPLHARRIMHGVWGAGQMSWTKNVVVVDDDVDVHDTTAVLRAIGEFCVPARDIERVRGPVDILDHAAPFLGAGTKIGLDATRKSSPAEEFRSLEGLAADLCAAGPIPPVTGDRAAASESRLRRLPGVLDARLPEELGGWWLFLRMHKAAAGEGARLIKTLGGMTEEIGIPRWVVILGTDADLSSIDDALFHWAANTSADRDMFLTVCGRRVAFDATPKLPGDDHNGVPVRHWPPIIRMTQDVRDLVRRRWSEYGLPADAAPTA